MKCFANKGLFTRETKKNNFFHFQQGKKFGGWLNPPYSPFSNFACFKYRSFSTDTKNNSEKLRELQDKLVKMQIEMENIRNEVNQIMGDSNEPTEIKKEKLPLEGVKVLDLSRILAGPFCTMNLADLGAEVIKVEKNGEGDATRTWGPPFIGGESTYYLCTNRNKKSITLDLRTKEGVDIIKQLVRKSDVVVENFVPGSAEELGISYEDLRKENEGIIYAAISGYGTTGPYASRPGYDVMITAMGGMMSITGEENGNPVKIGVALIDLITGLYAVSTIASSLYQRNFTGKGKKIELSLLDSQVASLANVASAYLNGGLIPKRWGTAHGSIVPYQSFKTTDGYIVLGANSDQQWQNLCKVLEIPDYAADQRFITNKGRVKHRDEIIAKVQECIIKKSKKDWVELLSKYKVSVCPINNVDEVFQDPHVIFRNLVSEISHPTAGHVKLLSFPALLDDERPMPRSAPPLLGEHTDEVLKNILNYSDSDISSLRDKKII